MEKPCSTNKILNQLMAMKASALVVQGQAQSKTVGTSATASHHQMSTGKNISTEQKEKKLSPPIESFMNQQLIENTNTGG